MLGWFIAIVSQPVLFRLPPSLFRDVRRVHGPGRLPLGEGNRSGAHGTRSRLQWTFQGIHFRPASARSLSTGQRRPAALSIRLWLS